MNTVSTDTNKQTALNALSETPTTLAREMALRMSAGVAVRGTFVRRMCCGSTGAGWRWRGPRGLNADAVRSATCLSGCMSGRNPCHTPFIRGHPSAVTQCHPAQTTAATNGTGSATTGTEIAILAVLEAGAAGGTETSRGGDQVGRAVHAVVGIDEVWSCSCALVLLQLIFL
jgi:hypothetical protein